MINDRNDPLTAPVIPVFFRYAVPTTVGMLSATSASIIDGMFVGNFVGHQALAALTFSMPVVMLLLGMSFMLDTGGSVIVGRLIGEGKVPQARQAFTAVLLSILLVGLLFVAVALWFLPAVVSVLGVHDEPQVATLVSQYLGIILLFAPVMLLGMGITIMMQMDNHPLLASLSMVLTALTNVLLDWLFIVQWGWEVEGAALATGLSFGLAWLLGLVYWLSPRRQMALVWPKHWWRITRQASFNGISELATESSSGVTTLIFNWVIVLALGVTGVAAFSIVSYIYQVGLLTTFGIADSLRPLVSKNLGAGNTRRIEAFLKTASLTALGVGIVLIGLLVGIPEKIVAVFLEAGAEDTRVFSLSFIAWLWPAFIFLGANIVMSSYLTAMHLPIPSALVALSRTLAFPALYLLSLPGLLGDRGIFMAIALSELSCFALTVYFYFKYQPRRLVTVSV